MSWKSSCAVVRGRVPKGLAVLALAGLALWLSGCTEEVAGSPGPQGDTPDHEWTGTELRFENPDGTWGTYVDLQGLPDAIHEWAGTMLRLQYPDLTWGAWVDLEGPQGPQGLQGIQGPQGIPGAQGPKGDTGDTGPQGPKGDQGDPPAYEWMSTQLRFQNPDLTWGSWVDLEGQPGPQGPQGLKGDKGDKGDPGTGSGTVTQINAGTGITCAPNPITDTGTISATLGTSIDSSEIVNGTIADADISAGAAISPSKISGGAWTATNDGSGSTLDADLLDGSHASAFAGSSHSHPGSDITSGTVADARIASSIARDSEIMPTVLANDGPGSGLNADFVDGQHASAFLTSESDTLQSVCNRGNTTSTGMQVGGQLRVDTMLQLDSAGFMFTNNSTTAGGSGSIVWSETAGNPTIWVGNKGAGYADLYYNVPTSGSYHVFRVGNSTKFEVHDVGVGGVWVTGNASISGNCDIVGNLTKGSGTFLIDHPLDPYNKVLRHSFVESPDMKNIYDGVARLNANGEAVVEFPDYFEALNMDFRYQLTAIGASMPGLYVKEKITARTFVVAGGAPGGEVSWQVTGVRKDAYAMAHRIVVEEEKGTGTASRYTKGELIHEEAGAEAVASMD